MNTQTPFTAQITDGNARDGLTVLSAQLLAAFGKEHDIGTDQHSTIHATGSIAERGRSAAIGEWINPRFSAKDYTVTGAGNSWTVSAPSTGNPLYPVSYTLIGTTMFLNIDVVNSALTIATPTSAVYLTLPDGYRVAGLGSAAVRQRTHFGFCYIIDNATAGAGILQVAPSTSVAQTQVAISLVSGANFVTGGFTVIGQVFFEVAL